ncbi:hypothetical protein PAXRUDRAFT_18868 [Paxillus rubicundulus Ve08.2h10]|uniref:Uncharacterized protein n=1 Tax=Paxillus rubicundulus Ve08.2h10 TaxID=930991 RepID=A0A0D0BW83_9AGAM|nr:hypothetical protein PAXRUDRAFT_18868 [Paxillus rubicundulus Ve08.2h10]
MVGHSGKNGCRIYCGVVSRRKTNGRHYYPVLIKPRDRCVAGSDHVDYNVFDLPSGNSHTYTQNLKELISSPNQTQYYKRKTSTGITKAPLILGMSPSHSLGVPYCMTTDIMHLAGNLSDLLISLWCGMIDCDPSDAINSWDWVVLSDGVIWDAYGVSVHEAGSHLPGSFGIRPHNIAEKLTSGYKTYSQAIQTFLGVGHPIPPFKRWARLRLKNRQIAQSAWRETLKAAHGNLRISRNVSFSFLADMHFGEIQYFARLPYCVDEETQDYDYHNIAIIKLYSHPDEDLFHLSSQTVTTCNLSNELIVIDVKQIKSVVAMIPRRLRLPSCIEEERFCVLSQPGLDVSLLGMPYDIFEDEDNVGGNVK